MHTIRNVRKFTKFLCYTGNVKFDIYDIFELQYLKLAKNVLKFLTFFLRGKIHVNFFKN